MQTNYLSAAMAASMLSLTSLIMAPSTDLHAADVFTKVTAGPGSDAGNGYSAAWGDYDNDGFTELCVPQTGPGGSGSASHFLYHNSGGGTFRRTTSGLIAVLQSAATAAAWGDYDNDGYLDLVLVNANETNYLFHNNGEGSFALDPGTVSPPISLAPAA